MANTSVNQARSVYCVVHEKPGCSIRKVMFRLISVRYFKQHLLVHLFCLIVSIVIFS